MVRRIALHLVVLSHLFVVSCGSSAPPPTTAVKRAIETRQYNVDFDTLMKGSIGVLQDLGYTIDVLNDNYGLITATKQTTLGGGSDEKEMSKGQKAAIGIGVILTLGLLAAAGGDKDDDNNDDQCVEDGWVSITPLQFNLTHQIYFDYKIIICEQNDNNIFSKTKLLNQGFKYAESSLSIEITISVIYFIAFLFSVYFIYTNRLLLLANVAGIINVLCLSAFTAFVTPKLEKIWISENIHGYVKNNNIDKPVILLGYSEPSAVFRLGSDTLIANNVEESLFHLKNGKKNLLIVEKKFEDILIEKIKFMGIKIHKHDYQIEGINYSKGKEVLLSIYSN